MCNEDPYIGILVVCHRLVFKYYRVVTGGLVTCRLSRAVIRCRLAGKVMVVLLEFFLVDSCFFYDAFRVSSLPVLHVTCLGAY